jgi:hypothetical protein
MCRCIVYITNRMEWSSSTASYQQNCWRMDARDRMGMGTTCPPLLGALLPRDGAKFSTESALVWERVTRSGEKAATLYNSCSSCRGTPTPRDRDDTPLHQSVTTLLSQLHLSLHQSNLLQDRSRIRTWKKIQRVLYILPDCHATVHHAARSLPIFVYIDGRSDQWSIHVQYLKIWNGYK